MISSVSFYLTIYMTSCDCIMRLFSGGILDYWRYSDTYLNALTLVPPWSPCYDKANPVVTVFKVVTMTTHAQWLNWCKAYEFLCWARDEE